MIVWSGFEGMREVEDDGRQDGSMVGGANEGGLYGNIFPSNISHRINGTVDDAVTERALVRTLSRC